MSNEKQAKKLLKLAEEIVAQDEPSDEEVEELKGKVEDKAQEVDQLVQDFKDAHSEILEERERLKAKMKEVEDQLGDAVKDWKKEVGYDKVKRELLKQANQCLALGEKWEDVGDNLEIIRRESSQEVWKKKFEVLWSTMNEAEREKFGPILNTSFKKVKTVVDASVDKLSDKHDDFQEQAKAIAKERGVKLSSVDKGRQAGRISDALKSIYEELAPDFIKDLADWFGRQFKKLTKSSEELDEIEDEVENLNDTLASVAK